MVEASNSGSKYRYWAFISYSHLDEAWAKWLHRALETYRLPKRLKPRETGAESVPRRLLPIFRDTDELPVSSNLGAKLEESLRGSRFLIVICSPNSAQSKWVDQEIRTFQTSGGANRIFTLIVDGEANATDPVQECFPPSLRLGDSEPLACDPRDDRDGKANCKLRLIAGMLGLSFDELKRRDRQRRIRRAVALSVAGLVLAGVLGAISYYSISQSKIAESRRRAVESQQTVEQDPVKGLELAIQAAESASTAEAAKALSTALTYQLARTILNHPSPVISATFSPDAQRVLTCTADGTSRVWETSSGRFQFALKNENKSEEMRLGTCIFSPDGTLILTVFGDAGPKLWNSQIGQLSAQLSGHTGQVLSGSFSSDGSKVLTAGLDKTARLWDARTGQQLMVFTGHDTAVHDAFFFPDNSRVVSIGSEGKAIVWDASTGEQLAGFGEYVPFVQDAALSPDGSRLLISNYQYSANLWDTNTGSLIKQLTTRSLGANFSHDGSVLITGSGDGRVTVWQAEDGLTVKELFHDNPVSSVLFSPEGSLVVTADDRPHVWNKPELGGGAEQEIFSLHGHNTGVVIAGFSTDGKLLLTFGPTDRTVRVWDIIGGPHVKSFGELDPRIGNVSFSPDGSKIMTSGDRLQIWNANATQLLATTQVPPYLSSGVQFSSNGTRLIARCFKASVCVFDTSNGALVSKLDGVQTLASAVSPDGSRIALGSSDHAVVLFEMPSGNKLKVFPGEQGGPNSIVFSADGRQILASYDGGQRVWDSASGQLVRTLKGYDPVFSPDGKLMANHKRETAHLYNLSDGRHIREWKVRAEAIETTTFSADSLWFAAGSSDGVINVWDVKNGNERLAFNPEDGRVRSLRFSADGKRLIAITDGAIHCYDLSDGSEWQTFRNNFGMIDSAVAPDGSRVVVTDTLGRALLYSFQVQDLLEAAQKRKPAIGTAP